jgi:hypothetical protein
VNRAKITVIFTDGEPDFSYEAEAMRAKHYAHQIISGQGFRKRVGDGYVYFPVHRIKEVRVEALDESAWLFEEVPENENV